MAIDDYLHLVKRRLKGRDVDEAHRVSSGLELLFDLSCVVAVSACAAQLHHAIAQGHLLQGIMGFLVVFFAIWWMWIGFTWFSSAYDTDDVGFRIMTMVQMLGVLILSAGIPRAMAGDFTIGVIGYVVMRTGMVSLWLRAARDDEKRRRTCIRYAIGIVVVQILWIIRLFLPEVLGWIAVIVLVFCELWVPAWAERAGPTPWHPHHIAERYSLFTLIVLGECILSVSNAIAGLIEIHASSMDIASVGFGAIGLIFSLWWIYSFVPSGSALAAHRERVLTWGYGHYFILGSLAALGASLGVLADQLKTTQTVKAVEHMAHSAAHGVSPTVSISLVVAATSVYLLTLAWINGRVTRHAAKLSWILLPCAVIFAGVIVAVELGLHLPFAIPLLALGPISMIVLIERAIKRDPAAFAIT